MGRVPEMEGQPSGHIEPLRLIADGDAPMSSLEWSILLEWPWLRGELWGMRLSVRVSRPLIYPLICRGIGTLRRASISEVCAGEICGRSRCGGVLEHALATSNQESKKKEYMSR